MSRIPACGQGTGNAPRCCRRRRGRGSGRRRRGRVCRPRRPCSWSAPPPASSGPPTLCGFAATYLLGFAATYLLRRSSSPALTKSAECKGYTCRRLTLRVRAKPAFQHPRHDQPALRRDNRPLPVHRLDNMPSSSDAAMSDVRRTLGVLGGEKARPRRYLRDVLDGN